MALINRQNDNSFGINQLQLQNFQANNKAEEGTAKHFKPLHQGVAFLSSNTNNNNNNKQQTENLLKHFDVHFGKQISVESMLNA